MSNLLWMEAKNIWTPSCVCVWSSRYYEITSEVLTSVKRTEDSLMKLRRNRQSSVLPAGGMSDDNKIRLQLALDIEQYSTQVRTTEMETLKHNIIHRHRFSELSFQHSIIIELLGLHLGKQLKPYNNYACKASIKMVESCIFNCMMRFIFAPPCCHWQLHVQSE